MKHWTIIVTPASMVCVSVSMKKNTNKWWNEVIWDYDDDSEILKSSPAFLASSLNDSSGEDNPGTSNGILTVPNTHKLTHGCTNYFLDFTTSCKHTRTHTHTHAERGQCWTELVWIWPYRIYTRCNQTWKQQPPPPPLLWGVQQQAQ